MKRLLYIVFMFNFLFSLLTAILPLLVFDITSSVATSGYVLSTFMVALLGTRIVLLTHEIDAYLLLKIGLTAYCLGFLLLLVNATAITMFYLGAIMFGMGVGIVAPILITIITGMSQKPNAAVGWHNSLLGVASAIAPILGVSLYYFFDNRGFLYLIMTILSITTLGLAIFIRRIGDKKIFKKTKINGEAFSKEYIPSYIIFLLTSISYGAVIAFSPIFFEMIGLRVDVFYFFFWSFFILAQLSMLKIKEKIAENKLLNISILFIFMSSLSIVFTTNYAMLILTAIVFGVSYGGIMNLFYNRIAIVKESKAKSDAYSIFGLMSYLGVGLGSMILSPIANHSLMVLFIISSLFPLVGGLINLLLDRKSKANMLTNKQVEI
ncbi:MFS transporter [Halalkalibacter alkalisediminis]|uniref:MFS transporter n=1 Tax=Halalkalibacter alkalisediminis TaxID=935616 RepID=A0ABV6NMS6_9BACI|nr:MFS transporter [Halalkalibacter alkalisediminis]